MNATCFSDDLMERLAKMCERMAPGSFVITTTKSLPSEEFTILDRVFDDIPFSLNSFPKTNQHKYLFLIFVCVKGMMMETWGEATTFIQKRGPVD